MTDPDNAPTGDQDREWVVLICVVDGLPHVVTTEEVRSPEAMRRGRYEALCGHLVAPSPETDPGDGAAGAAGAAAPG